MKKSLFVITILLSWITYAEAQPLPTGSACPYITYGAVLTPGQWNYCFQIKQDNFGYTPLNLAGGILTGPLTTAVPTANGAMFNLPPGTTPTLPNNGDVWETSTAIFARINGTTNNLLLSSSNLSDIASASTSRTNLGLGTVATQNTGTSGANIPFLNGTNTWSGTNTFPSNSLTLTEIAQIKLWSVLGNATSSTANVTAFTISDLTQKVTPAGTDLIMIQDQAASGAFKYATVSSVGSSSGVSSLNTATGAVVFTVPPQGRLTLTTGVPVLSANATAQSTLYYDCLNGANMVPYYTGSADAIDTIASCEVSDAMVSAASAGQVVSGQVYDVWWVHGGANRICLAMSASGGGGGGWASDSGSPSNTARGTGYSQLDLTSRPYITNKNSIANCFNGATNYGSVSANQGTYLGTIYATANGQTSMTFTASASGGGANILGVYNAYNRVNVVATSADSNGSSWTVPNATWRKADNNANNSISWVDGLKQSGVSGSYNVIIESLAAGGGVIGCQANWTSGTPTATAIGPFAAGIAVYMNTFVPCSSLPLNGFNVMNALEASYNASSILMYSNGFAGSTGQSQLLTIQLQM